MMNFSRTLVCILASVALTACAGDDTGDTDDSESSASTSTSGTTTDSTTTGAETSGTTVDPSTTDPSTSSTTDPSTSSTTDPSTSTTDPSTSSTTDPSTSTTDPTTTTDGGLSFAADVYPIISMRCSCHVGGSPAGLSMANSQTAYDNLVGVPASQAPGLSRIEPGSTDDSYLFHKINGSHVDVGGTGTPMPPNNPLDALQKGTIADWITDGALP